MTKRILSLLFAIILLISAVPVWSVTVNAAYENTYVNTGDQAADIIGVALTQLGYTEGYNNDTKYGDWYGLSNHAWCGMFVSWCANQAGIPTTILKKYARSNPAGYGLKELSGTSYRPKPGDLFFNRSYSHVGIVYYTEGDYFYTLEGNAGSGANKVVSQKKLISSYLFGSPNYRGGADHSYTTLYESDHPHKEYKVCSHCSDVYYTGNTSTSSSCKTCIQNSCSHNYSAWKTIGDSKHTRVCSICEKTQTDDHHWNSGTITVSPNCAKSGSKLQTCTDCGAERTVTIPKTTVHEFGPNSFVDEESHRKECSICKFQETTAHIGADQWVADSSYHWHACTDCSERYLLGEHSFADCETPCSECGYVREDGHLLKDTPSSDDSGHWYDCENCDKKVNFTEHHYSADCAENCDGCNYTRQTEHTFGTTWQQSASSHWQECSVCGLTKDHAAHSPDPDAADWETQLCTVCTYMLRSADEHVHSYHTVSYDNRIHWGSCACGHVMGSEAHSWSMQTKKCSVCNLDSAALDEQAETQRTMYWFAIVLGSVGLFSTFVAIVCRPRKKRHAKAPKRVKTTA